MNDKVMVTLVFYEPDEKNNLRMREFSARLNSVAPLEVLLPELLKSYQEVKMGSPEQVDVLLNIPRSSSLSRASVVDGSTIVILPKFISGSLVERQDKPSR